MIIDTFKILVHLMFCSVDVSKRHRDYSHVFALKSFLCCPLTSEPCDRDDDAEAGSPDVEPGTELDEGV